MYRYSEIRNRPLPHDVNAFLRTFAQMIHCAAMEERIEAIERGRLFGTLVVLDASGFTVAECHFREGVCPNAMLEREAGVPIVGPFRVRFRENKRNKNVVMDRPEKGER